jgi:hypothetical protein
MPRFKPASALIPALWLVPVMAGNFDLPEPVIRPSPDSERSLAIPADERVQDLDVSPWSGKAAVLIRGKGGHEEVRVWDMKSDSAAPVWTVPDSIQAKSIAWHPAKDAFFILGRTGKASILLSIGSGSKGMKARTVYRTLDTLRRLAVGPRPFRTGWPDTLEYRVFFGRKDPSGGFSIRSVTESGRKVYQVIGKTENLTARGEGDGEAPSTMVAPSALPIGFHPAGDILLWEDGRSCFEAAEYGSKYWAKSRPILDGKVCGGTVTVLPNGLGLLHWRPGADGLESILFNGKVRRRQAAGHAFAFTPSSTPDGKGVVGLVHGGADSIAYVPIAIPMADVANAWMFAESEGDLARFSGAGSVLRNTGFEQMYKLYETENYNCGEYDATQAARPYYVTTDALWEVFAAAFEGLFVVTERNASIPAFWAFVHEASLHFASRAPDAYWGKVFAVLDALKRESPVRNPEAQKIHTAQGKSVSPALGREVDYGVLKPRGNYASNPELQAYFKAFTYLTRLATDEKAPMRELADAPASVKEKAALWIEPYRLFISGSRSPLVWSPTPSGKLPYVKHPEGLPKLFPLSWAMDNEILNSTVYHEKWPEAEQIKGAGGFRMMASALDIPAALGNPLALARIKGEIDRYPPLGPALQDLRKRSWPARGSGLTLYDRWMNALQVQWSASPARPGNRADWTTWDAKRLQTGLASWTTLRHATVLVNETTSAECGEGGYEELIMRPPRGYVEPDPATFRALAGLFDAAETGLKGLPLSRADARSDSAGIPELRDGLLKRLKESAAKARAFASMAEKELRGQALSDSEYSEILTVGRTAEHHFLVYKSLSTKAMGLADPEPMPKIVDVAHGPDGKPYLFAAVGHPMEWNQVVPFYGRRQIVKGPIYSFYEFKSDTLYNDKEWQANLSRRNRPAWIAPYVSDKRLSCPPLKPF